MTDSRAKSRFCAITEHLSVEVVRSAEEFAALREEWDALFHSARAARVFQSFGWCFAWWKHIGRATQPLILLAREQQRLVGIAPFCLRERAGGPQLHLIGGLQYLGLLVIDERPDIPAAIAAKISELFPRGIIFLQSCAAGEPVTDFFAAALKSMNWYESRWVRDICHQIHEENGYEALLARKSHKSRYNIRRERKILDQRGNLEIFRFRGPEITMETIGRIASIQKRSWLARRGQEPVNSPFWKEAVLAAASMGCAEIFIMSLDGEDKAYILNCLSNVSAYCMLIGFDQQFEKLSPGKALMSTAVESVLNDGKTIYDFLFGDADYKRFWGNRTLFVYSMIYCKGVVPWLVSWFPFRLHAVFGRYNFLRHWVHRVRATMANFSRHTGPGKEKL